MDWHADSRPRAAFILIAVALTAGACFVTGVKEGSLGKTEEILSRDHGYGKCQQSEPGLALPQETSIENYAERERDSRQQNGDESEPERELDNFMHSAGLRVRMAAALAVTYACVLCYGVIRLHTTPETSNSVLVGLVETHAGPRIFPQDAQSSLALLHEYASQVQPLAARGAQFVVFPEMSALIPDSASAQVDKLFQQTARNAHVQVLLGVLHVTDHGAYNEGRLYSAAGDIETVYRKHHLVPTWESRSTPGTEISVLSQPAGKIGIEICRDMDYPELARRYANQQVGLVLVPAWDQGVNVDAAWHGHLSLMRSVENGFPMVRDAKNGLLTASDDRGRILAEKSTRSDGALVTLLATVPLRHDSTLYQKWGDWFAWIDLLALAALLASWSANRKAQSSFPPTTTSIP